MADDDAPLEEVRDLVGRLYGLPLEDFTTERDAAAKELRGARRRDVAAAVKALAKPTTAAWAVNLLVRERRGEVEQLLALGARMQEAQRTLAGAELRRLTKEQHAVVRALGRAAAAVAADAGRSLTDAVVAEVEGTLRAAMADPDAAAAVAGGALTRALEPAGFGPVDLDGAAAVRAAGPVAATGPVSRTDGSTDGDGGADEAAGPHDDGRDDADSTGSTDSTDGGDGAEQRRAAEAARAEVEAALAEAEAEATAAREEHERTRADLDGLDARHAELAAQVAALEARLREAVAERDDVAARRRRARDDARAAERRAGAADRRVEATRRRLEGT